MRRLAVIFLGIVAGGMLGLYGGMAFFRLINPHPRVATQDAMGEGLCLLFLIIPVCAILGGVTMARLTRERE
jgi:hypothetical protein